VVVTAPDTTAEALNRCALLDKVHAESGGVVPASNSTVSVYVMNSNPPALLKYVKSPGYADIFDTVMTNCTTTWE
jgi:hypothetical protein